MADEFLQMLNDLEELAAGDDRAAEFAEKWQPFLKRQKHTQDTLTTVFDSIEHAIVVIDPETRSIIHCNKGVKTVFGYDPAEIIGRNTSVLHIDEEHYDLFAQQSEEALDRGGNFKTGFEMKRKGGSTFPAKISVNTIDPQETWLNGVVSIIEDITSQKKRDEQRKRNIKKLRFMTEQLPTLLWITDENLTITSILGKEAYKLRPENNPLIGRRISDIFEPKKDHDVIHSHERALSGERSDYELLYEGRMFKAYVEPLKDDEKGITGVIGVAFDITEQKKLEDQYKERVKELQCLSSLSELNIQYEYNIESFIENAVKILPTAFHYPESTFVRIRLNGSNYTSSEFRETDELLYKEISSADDDDYGRIEVFVDPEGVSKDSPLFLDEEKTLLRIIAERLGRIIERKRENESLNRSTKQLQAVVDSAMDSISLLNDDGIYIEVNPASCEMIGYSREELLGKPPRNFVKSEDEEKFSRLWKKLLEQGCLTGELQFQRKDGTAITVEYRAVANILPGIHLSINRNVTRQREYEENLEKALREREVLIKEIHHRVKNNLQIIASIFNLQTGPENDDKVREILETANNRVHSIAMVYNQIHISENLEVIDMKNYLQTFIGSLISAAEINVNVKYSLEPIWFNIDSAVPCGLIVNEVVTNSIQHAFPDGKKGEIQVALQLEGESQVRLTIRDNGTGFPEKLVPENSNSLGMQLMCSLSSQLEGKLEIHNDNGAVTVLTVPQKHISEINGSTASI